ncbi:GUN4 domain-containing protein [Tolypothrix sp. VBCCA 56010]|uniref:GUN4 domain-containing protein n=1 Tax=Tolypothrix sp. VBCCA 56010 TaxID=3137731 RepID=UPI003D7EE459
MQQPMFDVFLAHNSLDKPKIRIIYKYLKQLGLNPWLDEKGIRPGKLHQDVIQQIIKQVPCVAVFIGTSGLGKWQTLELKSFISQCVEKDIPVIPVLLPGVKNIPENLIFLREFHQVCFECEIEKDFEAFWSLYWGITGEELKIDRTVFSQLVQPDTSAVQSIEILNSNPVIQSPPQTDDLASEKGIDYTKLRNLLAAKNWKEADQETYRVMIQAVGKEDGDYFDEDELLNFPCTDLRTIDRLWVKYSNGHFGFSVQKEIYLSVGGLADGKYYKSAWEKLGDRVGWRVNRSWISYSSVTFDTSYPRGHLPKMEVRRGGNLFSRIETCKL